MVDVSVSSPPRPPPPPRHSVRVRPLLLFLLSALWSGPTAASLHGDAVTSPRGRRKSGVFVFVG